MLLKDIKALFNQDLHEIYSPFECSELFVIFCEKILGLDRLKIRAELENPISENQVKEFLEIISELQTGKPYQQILGEVYFFGNQFFIDENVLIPRPETEELIEIISQKLSDLKSEKFKVLDIGAGSGCIPISLAKIFPQAEITSIDISEKALKVARKNAEFHQVKINFIQKDYLNENLNEIYDVIVSNPPYIDVSERTEIPFSVKEFEPNIALFAPENQALAFYEKIAQDCQKYLKNGGWVFLEINQKLGKETLELFETQLTERILVQDLSQNDRFVIGRK